MASLYDFLIKPIHLEFNRLTEGRDFFLICLVYSIVFLIVAWRTHRKKGWVAPFRELLTTKEKISIFLFSIVKNLPIVSGLIKKKMEKEEEKVSTLLNSEFQKSLDPRRANLLPENGMTMQNLKKRIDEWTRRETVLCSTEKISGSIYIDNNGLKEGMAQFCKEYLYQNPLHLDTFKELLKMESEVLRMTGDLLSESKVYGTLTSGGSQSLILAIYTYKQFYSNRTKPNIVVPETAHAAIDKGCFYFNVELRKARLKDNFEVDVNHMKSLIDGNTIMIMGSAPNFPHGIIDPIPEIAKLAKKKNVGMHVDACLGGFVVAFADQLKINIPFNFKVDGVTSISIDHHKYGLAPKGVSGIFYKTKELRSAQYFCYADWCGGAYATATMPGSRSGVATSGAWFALNMITKEGYKENAKRIMETTVKVAAELRKIEGVEVFGDPRVCVVSFRTTSVNSFKLGRFLSKQRQWELSSLHRPVGLHISITPANQNKVLTNLVKDIRDGLKEIQQNPDKYKGSTEALYGGTADIPDTGIRQSILKLILQSYLRG